MTKRERKSFAFKGDVESNVIKGAASGIGNMDRGGDVICPGFFSDALAAFKLQGFVPVGHDWESLPVAMPLMAEERAGMLYCEAQFHSTNHAQDARTVVMERMSAGLDVALSIGFSVAMDGYKWFGSGDEMLKWLPENGYNVSQFDVASIKSWSGRCRALTKCAELFEYSIVSVPMNAKATASDVKFHQVNYWMDDDSGEYTAADATVAALNTLYYDLCDDVADVLYSDATPDEMMAALKPEFEMFATQSLALIGAIMTILSGNDAATKSRIVESVRKMARGTQVKPTSPANETSQTRGGDVQKTLSQTLSLLAATAAVYSERAKN
jgi:phage head maturation protease